jgi:hypothetical protein
MIPTILYAAQYYQLQELNIGDFSQTTKHKYTLQISEVFEQGFAEVKGYIKQAVGDGETVRARKIIGRRQQPA